MKTIIFAALYSLFATFALCEAPFAAEQTLVPKAAEVPVIDGDLSDPCWADAVVITDFKPALQSPDSPLQRTELLLCRQEEALYIAFRCSDSFVLSHGTLPRDSFLLNGDVCEVFISSDPNRRAYIELQVSPDSSLFDGIHLYTESLQHEPNGRIAGAIASRHRWSLPEFNLSGLQATAKRTADGWTAELLLPAQPLLKSIGARSFTEGLELFANFVRYDYTEKDKPFIQQSWSSVSFGSPHASPARFGTLKFVSTNAEE